MQWLNYHHLLYFWTVAREGGIVPASRVLRLAHPTISGQLRQLEDALGEKLFERKGRRLELTEVGQVVYRYADEIFSLGNEMLDVLGERTTGRAVQLRVGVTDVVPKLVVRRLLEPALRLPEPVHLTVEEGTHDRLLASLATHGLDVMLADAPVPPGSSVRAFNHLLGDCDVTVFGQAKLARALRQGFPMSLDGAPMLMPTQGTALRRSLDAWLTGLGIRPKIVAEIEDSALIKVFGADGLGVFLAPTVIRASVERHWEVKAIGLVPEIRDRFYAISVERRLKNPAVVAISNAARQELFAPDGA